MGQQLKLAEYMFFTVILDWKENCSLVFSQPSERSEKALDCSSDNMKHKLLEE